MRLSAAAAGAAALSPALSWSVRAQEAPSVGIVGGGVAGLTSAYRLQAAGAKPVLFNDGLAKMAPKIAESLDPLAVTSFFWATYPYTLGSYASASVGQYATLLNVAIDPALDGLVQFAGEHTSSEWLGHMNGGVQSGERVSEALIELLELKK